MGKRGSQSQSQGQPRSQRQPQSQPQANQRPRREGEQHAGDTFVIRDVKTLKAIVDPLRHEMLRHLDSPRTVKELAHRLHRPPDRLYYHLGLLERHGIITAIEQRGAERRYQTSAEDIVIDPDLTLPPGVVVGLIGTVLHQAHREYEAASRLPASAGKKRSLIGLQHVRVTEAERAELAERLLALVKEYEARHPHAASSGSGASEAAGSGSARRGGNRDGGNRDGGNGDGGRGDGPTDIETFGILVGLWPVVQDD